MARYIELRRGDIHITLLMQSTRPFKNLEEYRVHCCHYVERFIADGTWPCLPCGAVGWQYDPDDPPCPVEVNKGRRRLKCQACGGTGIGDRATIQRAYRNEIERWRKRVSHESRHLDLLMSAAGKLTDDELTTLIHYLSRDHRHKMALPYDAGGKTRVLKI